MREARVSIGTTKTPSLPPTFERLIGPPEGRRERALWAVAYLFACMWALSGLQFAIAQDFDASLLMQVLLRLALAGLAANALLRLSRGVDLPETTASMFFISALVLQGCALAIEESASMPGLAIQAALFLAAAITHRGPDSQWWHFSVPISSLVMFLPIMRWEAAGDMAMEEAARLAILPCAALGTGALVPHFLNLRRLSLEARAELGRLVSTSQNLRHDVKQMEADLRGLLMQPPLAMQLAEPALVVPRAQPMPPLPSLDEDETPLIMTNEPNGALQVPPLPTLTQSEVQKIVAEAVAEAREVYRERVRTRMVVKMDPEGVAGPIMHGTREALDSLVRSLLRHSIESLPAGEGVVRIEVQPKFAHLAISFEDNGRGLNEELLARVEPKNMQGKVSFSEIREMADRAGFSLEREARLGVGSRTSVDLVRVDVLTPGMRAPLRSLRGPRGTSPRHA